MRIILSNNKHKFKPYKGLLKKVSRSPFNQETAISSYLAMLLFDHESFKTDHS